MLQMQPPISFLAGLGLIGLSFCVAVGSGFEMDVEHDDEHFWIVIGSSIVAFFGIVLIGVSLRRAGNVQPWKGHPSHETHPNHELD